MNAQAPAQGILLHRDYGDAKVYEIPCDCQNCNHSHKVWVEAEDTGITVTTYTTQETDWWTESVAKRYDIACPVLQEIDWFWKNLYNSIATRIRLTWQIWRHGYVKYEASLIMTQQQALNYAETLKSAVKDVEEFRNQRCSKNK
jgi:hypothetical protein